MAHTHTKNVRVSPQDSHIDEYDNSSREILEDRRRQLKRLAVPSYNYKNFISLPSMQGFWRNKENPLDKFLASVSCAIPPDKLELIRTTSLRILTALVLTEWRATNAVRNFCATFRRIFLDETNPQWNDELLLGPDGLGDLEWLQLSRDEKTSLENAILKVSVPVLQKSKERKPYSPKITLPIKSRKQIGAGAYGIVYEVQIEAGCILMENKSSDRIEENKADETFAWKKMNSVADGQTELNFARDYCKVTRTSEFVLEHLAIIEMDKTHASILYPLAQKNLQELLESKFQCEQWPEDDPKRFHKIIKKCYSLADGLDFLHNDLRDEGECFCRHGDLKPSNFLIFDKQWKISDMGLAKVKKRSNNEPGVKITTKTSRNFGSAVYAAPEMEPNEAMVGRSTDVWALAAIMTEIIIWGFGGSEARKEFVAQLQKYSKGWFHDDNVLSKAVDDELASWSKKHVDAATRCLGDQDSRDLAQQLLNDLVVGLRKALTIEVENRATSRDLLDSFQNILKYFSDPKSVDVGRQSLKQLTINEPSATTALTVLRSKHLEHEVFHKHLKPGEHIYISDENEVMIRKWITQRTPTAIALGIDEENQRFQLSAITHEIYYTARRENYKVVKFLTLDRYGRRSHSLKPSLDLVYCFIQQFIDCWGVKEYDVGRLAMHNPAVSDEMKFTSAVASLGSLIQTYGQDRNAKPLIIIIDEFWRVCPRDASETAKDQWRLLFAVLGCRQIQEPNVTNAASLPQSPHLKVLIRAKGYLDRLRHLGFEGTTHYPKPLKQSGQVLRKMVADSLAKYDKNAKASST